MKKIMFDNKFLLTQAVLDGRKTQTRRVINGVYSISCGGVTTDVMDIHRPYYKVGEVIAVAQSYKDIFSAFSQHPNPQLNIGVKNPTDTAGWNNKMFVKGELMPHQIRITDVRVERLQDISDDDCLKEGVRKFVNENGIYIQYYVGQGNNACSFENPCEAFAHLINKVSRKDVWNVNPYVFVYDFELVK